MSRAADICWLCPCILRKTESVGSNDVPLSEDSYSWKDDDSSPEISSAFQPNYTGTLHCSERLEC